jgi:hypothetical protein
LLRTVAALNADETMLSSYGDNVINFVREKQAMKSKILTISQWTVTGAVAAILAACGGGSGGSNASSSPPPVSTPQTGNVSMLISDASSEDWATIGVKVLSIALVPQAGGANVTVYTAPSPAPVINLVQLDQLGELIGNVSVPTGTYTGAVLTISGNPGDVLLNVAADPETGFGGTPGAAIPSSQIQIQHTQGSAPTLTVPVAVNFVTPLTVTANQNNQLDLEFDLGHPAFIVGHVPVGGGVTLWAVNFTGPVHHHPVADIRRLVLRHLYGAVTTIASDNSSITVDKEFPTEPVVTPETAVTSTQALQIFADATNGTIFYDVDAKTRTVITDFSAEGSLVGKSVRIAARYQQDGTLVATRIWASSTFNTVWVSPEGHVLHANAGSNTLVIENESGRGVPLQVDANTQFYFRTPQSAVADGTPIGTGPGFLTNDDIVRGFKVHASVVDPLSTPLVAQTIDIETAAYDGSISAPGTTGFTYTRKFHTASDDYVYSPAYIASGTANGSDPVSGAAITGYKWWNFAYPTLVTSGSDAIADFVSVTDGAVNFGGTVGAIPASGRSYTIWNDPASPASWSAAATIIAPSTLPLGFVATPLANNAFTMTVTGGAAAATVDVGTTSGSASLVYQVDRTNGIVTVTPVDITTSAGLTTLSNQLAVGAPVKVSGVPQADGSLRAYVLTYYTGDMPAQ